MPDRVQRSMLHALAPLLAAELAHQTGETCACGRSMWTMTRPRSSPMPTGRGDDRASARTWQPGAGEELGVSSRPPRNYVANDGQRFVIVFCGIGSTHRNLENRAPGRERHAVVGFSIRYQRAIPLQPIVRAWCSKATNGACEIPTSVRLP